MEKTQKNRQHTKLALFLIISAVFSLFLILNVSALTISNVVVNPDQVAPGQTARITLNIENNLNDDVENVNVALDFSSVTVPIAPYDGSSETTIDSINTDDSEKISFNVIVLPEAASGVYKIPVKIDYQISGDNTTLEKTGTISIIVNSPPKLHASYEGNLVKGMDNPIVIRVINDGLSDIKLASINIASAPGVILKSSSYEYLGNIDSDDFDSVDANFFVSETAGSYVSIPLVITYKDATNQDFTQNEVLNINVYSQDEAKRLGLIKSPSYTFYFVIGILIVIYIFYRIRKRMKKRKAQGA